MCGIAGFLGISVKSPDQVLKAMTDTIAHRGPDHQGLWSDRDAGIALGHRRLSILDLSPAGDQPMHSASGRFVVVFNGEIYNHGLIRAELECLSPRNWRGRSDTEVMLEAFEAWGVEAAVRRFTGMFAIALWDRRERKLFLIRDRIGEKPLYYGCCGNTILFGSELKALKAHPAFKGEIDRGALALYMRYCYVPAPYTIYKGIRKLVPGAMIVFDSGCSNPGGAVPAVYWSARDAAAQGLARPFRGTDAEAANALEKLLLDAIGGQMVADVPLGAFLSGGIDSSVIAALMQAQSSKRIRTFTIGTDDKQYNEAVQAKAVARHLGTDHTELYVSSSDALSVIPRLPGIYDEPFGDSSQIPTFLISQMTRSHVTVSLSGDAGDELFGGYNRYVWGKKIWNAARGIPYGMRRAAAASMTALSPQAWDKLFEFAGLAVPARYRQRMPGDRIHKLAGLLGAGSQAEMYRLQCSTWKDAGRIIPDAVEPVTALTDNALRLDIGDFILQMMYLDLISYLPGDILAKVDRAAMAVSLETRVPFLDHRVVEFAWQLPLDLKIRNGQGKWILRQVLHKHVPRELVDRPKMGFGVPIDMWLRGPLREWAESLLNEHRLAGEGYLDPAPVRELWEQHLSGRRNWQYHLWNVLMFQSWLEDQKA